MWTTLSTYLLQLEQFLVSQVTRPKVWLFDLDNKNEEMWLEEYMIDNDLIMEICLGFFGTPFGLVWVFQVLMIPQFLELNINSHIGVKLPYLHQEYLCC